MWQSIERISESRSAKKVQDNVKGNERLPDVDLTMGKGAPTYPIS